MSSQLNNRLKPIRIKITYNSKSFNIDVQPYKTIKYVKEQTKKHFFPIKNTPFSLLYQNKDLTPYESNLLGEYFKHKSTVCLRLLPLPSSSSSTTALLLQSCSENRLQLITEPNIDRYSQSHKHQQHQQQYTCYYDKEVISYYCRSCCCFICSTCKMSDSHITHSTVHVDVNKMEDSIRLYALTLQNDIHINMQSIKSNDTNGGSNSNTIYLDHYHTRVNAKEEAVLNKIDSLMSAYKEMSNILSIHAQNYYYQYDELIADFNKTAKEANDDLEQFIVNFYRKHNNQDKSKVSYNEMISLFKFIQNKENEYNERTKDALAFKINQELDTNITSMYNKLNEIVNEYANDSSTPFGLSTNSYYIYSLIKANCISRNDNRRKTAKKSQFLTQANNNNNNNEHSTFKREASNSKSKYSITAVDKDDRSKSNDSHPYTNSNSNNNHNSKKKITFNENFEEQLSLDKKAEISFSNKEIRKPNLLSRVYTKDMNAHNITQFFNGGKSRTPIKYMTHKITDKDKSVSEYSSINKEQTYSIAESNAEYSTVKRRKNASIASIKEIDNIFDIDNTSKFGNNNY